MQDYIIVSYIKGEEKTISTTNKRKCTLLKYSKGGENWAHRDDNSDGFFRARLCSCFLMVMNIMAVGSMLPGGLRTMAMFQLFERVAPNLLNAGDNDGDYEHGMKMVTRGERVAVAVRLLQPRKDKRW